MINFACMFVQIILNRTSRYFTNFSFHIAVIPVKDADSSVLITDSDGMDILIVHSRSCIMYVCACKRENRFCYPHKLSMH